MLKKINFIAAFLLMFTLGVSAQITSTSPYSNFGVGTLSGSLLPQQKAIGGLATAINKPDAYFNINVQNPASYGGLRLTVIDVGMSAGLSSLQKNNLKESNFTAAFSHLVFAMPLTKKSALSFGLLPYSNLGYNYKSSEVVNGQTFDYKYLGEGGLSKAYVGYGYEIGDHFRIGANAEYIFGNLEQNRATEMGNAPGSINTKLQNNNSIGGLSASYGLQYDFNVGRKTLVTIGYSGAYNASLNSKKSVYLTQYHIDAMGNELSAIDTLYSSEGAKSKLKLPLMHNVGITIQQNNKWMVGAELRSGAWSKMELDGVNQGLQDSYGASVGAQFIPDINAVNGYFNTVEYRLGVNYDKTYIRTQGQDIKQMGVALGFGFPLPAANRSTFYKINFTTELGKRGTLSNNLVKENFINFHLGFTLNDTWFRKYRID